MSEPVVCPKCDSVNKPRAVMCRMCGTRLMEPTGKRGRKTPVVLQRVMTGEVFSAIMGEVPKKPQGQEKDRGVRKEPESEPDQAPPTNLAEEDVADLLREILRMLQARQYEDALAAAEQILSERPNESKALVLKADALFRAGRHEEAGPVFDRLIAHDSGNAKLWLDRARVHTAMRALPEALQSYDKAVEIDEQLADAWYERALVLEMLGSVAEALKSVAKALEARADYPDAQHKHMELQDHLSRAQLRATAEEIDNQISEIEKVAADVELPAPPKRAIEERPTEEPRGPPLEDSPKIPTVVRETVLPRLPTYVDGLDDALLGGIPQGAIVVVAGPPGTMKSSLCLSIATWNAIRAERRTLYLSLEESRDSIEVQARSLGLPVDQVTNLVRIVDAKAVRDALRGDERDWMDTFTGFLEAVRTQWPFSILVLDSLEALEGIGGFPERRRGIFRLFERMRDLRATAFVIAERPDIVVRGNVLYGRWVEDFLADGVLLLRQHFVSDGEVQRRVRCVKMRGTRHETAYLVLLVDEGRMKTTKALAG